jgi:hypothetical protein
MYEAGVYLMPHTRQSVSDLLQDRWESDLPDRILEALKPFHGKPITTRLLDKLPGGRDEWRMRREYGWTRIENMPYIRTHGRDRNGVSIILARSEASVPLDLAFVEQDNVAYYLGRRERNHARMEARNDAAKLDAMASVLNRIEALNAAREAVLKDFEQLAGYGEIFNPDKYELERAAGLRDRE